MSSITNSIKYGYRFVVACCLFAAHTAQGAPPASDAAHQFRIEAQALRTALDAYSEQSRMQLFYSTDLVKAKKTTGVSGKLSNKEALQKLLKGSGLNFKVIDDNTITLEKMDKSKLTVENLMAAAGPFVLAEAGPEEKPYIGPVEQVDMTVRGGDWTGYNALNAYTGTKTDVSLFDTPESIQVVPKVVIDDQQAIGLGNVLQNVSGVSQGWGFGAAANETFQIRGFANSSIYRDGILTPNSTNISLANAARVEVLKGPAGMLYGRTEPGGLINVITKRPQQDAYYSLQQQFGSYDTYRTLLDATGSLSKDGTLLYRLNYEHLDSNSFRDYVFDNRDFVAPSLTWHISEDTQLDLDFMYQNRETINDSGIPYDLQLTGVVPGKIPFNFFRNEPTDYNNSEFYEGDVTLTHRFNEDWKIRSRFSIIRSNAATAQTSSNGAADDRGDLVRGFLKTADEFESEYGTVDVTGHFSTWELDHTLLVGADFYHASLSNASSPYRSGADGVPTVNVFHPVYGFTGFLDDPIGPFSETKNEWYGIYIQDQIALWEQWQLLFGSRFDHAEFKAGGQKKRVDEFSPRVGLLYHPVSWLGIYADYVETFNAVNRGTTVSGAIPDPEQSREYEVGLKGEWMEGRLSANLAFYELTKTNVQTPLPAPFQNKVAVTGEQRSRGIELDIRGQLTDFWNIIATYAYTDTEVTKDSAPLDVVIGSSGSGNEGNRFANVPRHAGSVWTTYDFTGLGVRGFSAGAGVFLASNRAGNIDNSFTLPGYARVDTMLKYQHKIGPSNISLQFNIENLLDKEYIASSNGFASFIHQTMPGTPRTFLGSVKVEF